MLAWEHTLHFYKSFAEVCIQYFVLVVLRISQSSSHWECMAVLILHDAVSPSGSSQA